MRSSSGLRQVTRGHMPTTGHSSPEESGKVDARTFREEGCFEVWAGGGPGPPRPVRDIIGGDPGRVGQREPSPAGGVCPRRGRLPRRAIVWVPDARGGPRLRHFADGRAGRRRSERCPLGRAWPRGLRATSASKESTAITALRKYVPRSPLYKKRLTTKAFDPTNPEPAVDSR